MGTCCTVACSGLGYPRHVKNSVAFVAFCLLEIDRRMQCALEMSNRCFPKFLISWIGSEHSSTFFRQWTSPTHAQSAFMNKETDSKGNMDACDCPICRKKLVCHENYIPNRDIFISHGQPRRWSGTFEVSDFTRLFIDDYRCEIKPKAKKQHDRKRWLRGTVLGKSTHLWVTPRGKGQPRETHSDALTVIYVCSWTHGR